MAVIRVFLLTFRRERLLRRAVASLRAQTFTDWICELHNDAPDDDRPARLLAELADERFILVQHDRNLGAGSFNLIFQGPDEPFYSLLEDDNWWEPDFLQSMLAAAEGHPEVSVAWSNQRLWQEQADGTWQDTGRLSHPYRDGDSPRLVAWGDPAQIYGAVHSHGAALFRSQSGRCYKTPEVPIAVVEMFRERLFPHPLLFVPRPLANFSITLLTARSQDRGEWAALQTMLAATFLKHALYDDARLEALWTAARESRPPRTTTLLLASLMEPSCRTMLRHARASDWLLLGRGLARRPYLVPRILLSRRRHASWWEFLDRASAERFAEQRGDSAPAQPT